MKSFPLRGLDDELDKTLKKVAKNTNLSINKLILKILKEKLGLSKKKTHTQEYDDLNFLFGTWNEAEFAEFEAAQAEFNKIDDELLELKPGNFGIVADD